MGGQAVAVAARRAAREARMRLDADRAARDGRIEEQVAAIIVAQQGTAAAERALQAARSAHAAEVAAAERVIGRAAAALLAERLTAREVATVTGLGEKRIRALVRAAGKDGGPGKPGGGSAGGAVVAAGVE